MRKKLRGIGIGILVLYVILGILFTLLQEQLIFRPNSLDAAHSFSFEFPHEEIWLENVDGLEDVDLHALYFAAPVKTDSLGTAIEPKVMLYFHGNSKSLEHWGKAAQPFVAGGYSVLMPDYRGFGKSTGKRTEEGLYSDAQAWFEKAESLSSESVVTYGRSLGTTFATYVAAKNDVDQLILEAPFSSMKEMAHRRFPIFPTSILLKWKMPTDELIKEVEEPIAIFHGTKDRIVPIKSGIKLKPLIKETDHFVIIEGAGHKNIDEYKEYQSLIVKLLPKN